MTAALASLLQASRFLPGFPGNGLAFLLAVTLKGTSVLVLAVILTVALRRASAAARHLVWTLALGAILALPVFSLTVPAWNLPLLSPWSARAGMQRGWRGRLARCMEGILATLLGRDRAARATATRAPAALLSTEYVAPLLRNRHEPAPQQPYSTAAEAARFPARAGLILPLWAMAALFLTARIVVGEVRVRRAVRRSSLFETIQSKSILKSVRSRLRISRAVALRTSAEIAIPFTQGAFRPTVLLPEEAQRWPGKQLEWVLAHELAHVRRCDYLTQIPAQLACTLFWFNPLVWLAALAMREERERACDDMVLGLGHRATDYAEFLLELSRGLRRLNGAWLTSVAMAQSSQLEVRMKALLDPKLNHRPLAASRVVLAATLAAVLILPVAAIRAGANNASGNISGTVRDPSGAVIPRAYITLINTTLNFRVAGDSGEDGAFEFPAMPAGRYRLEVTSPGFAYTKTAELELKPSADLHENITMDVGELLQEVVVHGHKSAENPPTSPPAPRRIRVGGMVQAAKLTSQVKPQYPAIAQKKGIQGTVILRAVIGTSGQILSLKPDNDPDPELTSSAMSAVGHWRYQPTLLNGEPVEVVTTITVAFRLDE
jgi:TonB family protein